jgi:hypothetical protein
MGNIINIFSKYFTVSEILRNEFGINEDEYEFKYDESMGRWGYIMKSPGSMN